MCGIIGYIGKRKVIPVLIEGLKRMEYRGYDSAGVAYIEDGKIVAVKSMGKIARLERRLQDVDTKSCLGIAHTRWATHGEPSEKNAHPHLDCTGRIAVVHNGIIENYRALRKYLQERGHRFTTDTDTEIIAHLIEEYYKKGIPFIDALTSALLQIEGTYGLAILNADEPNKLYAAKHGSPVIIGKGRGENFVASDAAAVIRYTNNVIYLNEGEVAEVTGDGFEIFTLRKDRVKPDVQKLTMTLQELEKGGYPHFMLKEIFEQPTTVRNAFRGRLNPEMGTARLNGLKSHLDVIENLKRIVITACGTSWHAALIGEYLIEELARIPVEVEYASEFRYRSPVLDDETAVFVISQSGETADTLAALREAHNQGVSAFGIVNVVGSTIARETDAGVYIHAGPEIGVASTKAFTSQITVLALIALMLGRRRGIVSAKRGYELVSHIAAIHEKIKWILDKQTENVKKIAEKYYKRNNALFLGRGINFPVALEGALKLKEISYIHAEGYPAAEMKHGPIALIDENMPVFFIAVDDLMYKKVVSNIEEVRSRKGKVIAIATLGNEEIRKYADDVVYIPETDYLLSPLLTVLPMQLFAYYAAVLRGCSIDQPRNLAKSVTVE